MQHRYFIHLSFDGTAYHGWQVQPQSVSVQSVVEHALATILRHTVNITGAGRTDAGVHARHMVAHFDAEELDCQQLTYKLNRLLPHDIAIERIERVGADMHARYSAKRRTYHYYIHTQKDVFRRAHSCEIHYPLDFDAMNTAARWLLQVEDFAAFCKSNSDVKTTLCQVMQAEWSCQGQGRWCFTITANRFLRNMVRAIVGTLIDAGRGRLDLQGFKNVVGSHARTQAGESMPAKALFLWKVEY